MGNFSIWAFLALVFSRASRGGRDSDTAADQSGAPDPISPDAGDAPPVVPGEDANAGEGAPDADGGATGGDMAAGGGAGFTLSAGQIEGYVAAQEAVDGVAGFIDGNIGDLTLSIGDLLGAAFTAATVDPEARLAAEAAVNGLSGSATEEEAVAAAEAITDLVVANRIAIAENFAQILDLPLDDLLVIAAGIEADVRAGLDMPEGLSAAEQAAFELIVAVQTNGTIVATLLNEANASFELGLEPFVYDAPDLPMDLTLDSLLVTATASVTAVGALAVPAVADLQAFVDQALMDSAAQGGETGMAGGDGDDATAGGVGDDATAGDDAMAGGDGDDAMAGGDGDDATAGGDGEETDPVAAPEDGQVDHPPATDTGDADTVTDTTDEDSSEAGLLDPVIADEGLLGSVTGDDGLLGDATGSEGLLGDLAGDDGALSDVTGSDGLLGDLTGTGLLSDGSVADDDPLLTEEAGLLDPVISDEGLLGSVTGDDGLLGDVTGSEGLLGDLAGDDGALSDVTGSDGLTGDLTGTGLLSDASVADDDPLLSEEAGLLDPVIADEGLLDSLFQPDSIETMDDDQLLLETVATEEEDLSVGIV
jgi:hypothetical protein